MQHSVRCIEKECRQCGRAFVANRTTTLYCSRPCARRADYLRNRTVILQRRQVYRKAHHDEVLAYQRVWYRRNYAKLAKKDSKWRAERRRKIAILRPRCVVCSDPINWQNPMISLITRTCGKRQCTRRAVDWFGAMKPRRKAA